MRKRLAILLLGLSANALASNMVNAGADKGLKFDVQPRVVSKAGLRKNDAFHQIPELEHLT